MSRSGADDDARARRAVAWLGWTVVACALLGTCAALWLLTHEPLLVAGYAGALVVLGALAAVLALGRGRRAPGEATGPDWSVTVAAINRPGVAVAITDRAGRLVCANPVFEARFGIDEPPPRLSSLAGTSLERLVAANRTAWRDGQASAELIEDTPEATRWRCSVERAGRGEDYLVWQITPVEGSDPTGDLAFQLQGDVGEMLSRAGLCAAIVDADGTIVTASSGLAERAFGDPFMALGGTRFVSLLHEDKAARVGWLREGGNGAPLTLYHVPLHAGDADAAASARDDALVLIADPGIGHGAGRDAGAAGPHLEELLGPLPLGLAMTDRDGRLLFANAAFMRAAGQEGAAMPTYPGDLVVQEDKAALSEAVRRCCRMPGGSADIAVRLASQPDEPVSLSLACMRGLGEATVLLGLTDSTEEARLKRQVAQATKMQAVGQLAGGVAHDFNNVLTAILGTCDLMLMRHLPGDSDYDDIQQIRANSNRAAALTRQLLAFSRQQTLRPEVLQLPDVVSDATQLLRRLVGEKIELVVEHGRDLHPVRADPGQLGQVVMNLVVNARDAIHARGDGRGRITLATERVGARQIRDLQNEIIPAGDYTALTVTDNGVGIAREHLAKIFEPFFTTKEQGKGTGLGLSTVYGFVKQSGGFVFADSAVGHGTCFTVYLPAEQGVQPAGARAVPERTASPSRWAGGGKVLLVEDEDAVRTVAERALTRQGYRVTPASDGEEGLELVLGGGAFDIVVSDVVMPIMDGPAMAREIRKIAPDLPLLFMSGYAEEQLRKQLDLDHVHFMSKPFSVQQISDKVSEVLAGR